MSDGPEGQRTWKQGWRTRAPEFPVSGPSSPAFGAHPNSPSPHSSLLPLSRECHLGGICQGNVPKWPSHPPASPLPGPGRGKGSKFPQVSKLELRKEDVGLTERLGPLRETSGQGTGLFP